MALYRIIGNMTGNSMDAIDLVLTEFDGNRMTDICTFSRPFSKQMQEKMDQILRPLVFNKTKSEILALPEFRPIHDAYIQEVADCINEMIRQNHLDKNTINAIGFHGKTLDHNPPSKARIDGTTPYTLQIGSGQMLANLTGINVISDFRSAYIMNGFDGAPLVPAHNAHLATVEGDGCYYNGGNTSNFAWIINGRVYLCSDAGPCNEYTDHFIRAKTNDSYDKDGHYGAKGHLIPDLIQRLFDLGRFFYERPIPKSGDPAYYFSEDIFSDIEQRYGKLTPDSQTFYDIVHTFEYFAAYIAVHALTLMRTKEKLPNAFILFGGGWKNPVVRHSFNDLMAGKGYLLPEHKTSFQSFLSHFNQAPVIRYSDFGTFMEARLFADLACYYLEGKPWEIPDGTAHGKKIIAGVMHQPQIGKSFFDDSVNLAAKGWEKQKI